MVVGGGGKGFRGLNWTKVSGSNESVPSSALKIESLVFGFRFSALGFPPFPLVCWGGGTIRSGVGLGGWLYRVFGA